jgi:hypothetical protein
LILSAQISFVAADVAKIKIDMTRDWTAKLSYEGPRGSGQTSFNLNTKP